MSRIYEVRSASRGDGKTHYWGARNSREEAESLLAERTTGKQLDWARQYHSRWWIEEIDTTGMFEFPDLPLPRERFTARTTPVKNAPETWDTLLVEVRDAEGRVIANYPRNHWAMYRTFEPFRQGTRMLALVSGDYTATSVMDLATGTIIATETPLYGGFCPLGFYVPDWWDINDNSILPGSRYWSDDRQEPSGNFGFVWGCIWGDDSSWKIQYLDLSQVQQGKIFRDDRFGYVELATNAKLGPKDFIDCSFRDGKCKVTFSVRATFDLVSGQRQVNEFE